MTVLETYKKEFKELLPTLKGGQNISRAREKGMERFVFLGGIPGPKAEDWRYSDLRAIRARHLSCLERPPAQTVPGFGPLTRWPVVVVLNGKILGSTPVLKGVEILGADQALDKFPAWADGYLSPGMEENPLERLNLALSEDGLFINIAKNTALKGLEIIFLEGGDKTNAHHLRNFIGLETGAKAQILFRTISLEKNPGWTNIVSNFSLSKGAHLSLVCDFDQKEKSFLTGGNFVRMDEETSFSQVSLALGLTAHRFETEVNLIGKGADAQLFAALLAGRGEVVDFVSRIHHSRPQAKSRQTIKAVSGFEGKTAFQGRVVVEENAQKTVAHQNCSNLILEPTGEANVKPELLIFADDVVCSHGATVGEIDEMALFYMMQRGIPEAEAKAILVRAFLGDVVESLESEVLRTYFEDKIEAWMKQNIGTDQR
jgi:Fe-S cluster assembly protein SufD